VRSCYREMLISAIELNGQNFLDDGDSSDMWNFLLGQVSYLYTITDLCGHNGRASGKLLHVV
jgi:hypothetical protein